MRKRDKERRESWVSEISYVRELWSRAHYEIETLNSNEDSISSRCSWVKPRQPNKYWYEHERRYVSSLRTTYLSTALVVDDTYSWWKINYPCQHGSQWRWYHDCRVCGGERHHEFWTWLATEVFCRRCHLTYGLPCSKMILGIKTIIPSPTPSSLIQRLSRANGCLKRRRLTPSLLTLCWPFRIIRKG